eukprot:scaffold84970_cov31-Tisochrysis_lutea.AAC.2
MMITLSTCKKNLKVQGSGLTPFPIARLASSTSRLPVVIILTSLPIASLPSLPHSFFFDFGGAAQVLYHGPGSAC